MSALCGASAGLAIGTKLTGLVLLPLISLYLIHAVVTGPNRRWKTLLTRLSQGLVIFGSAAATYLAGWVAHFVLLTNPGAGDAFHATTGRFFHDLWVIHKTMWTLNVSMTQTHPDASAPWTWPLMKVVPFFWAGDGATIYMVGNPVVWWGASLLFVVLVVNSVLTKVTSLRTNSSDTRSYLWLPLVGFLISFLPLFRVTRVLFMYHYFTPLVFSVAFVLIWLDRAGWIRTGRLRDQRMSYVGTIAVLVIAFLLLSPLTYGFSAGQYDEWLAGVIRGWR